MTRRTLSLALAFLAAAAPAFAAPKPKPKPPAKVPAPAEDPDAFVITVTGEKPKAAAPENAAPVGEVSSKATVTKTSFEKTHKTVAEALREVTGIQVRTSGGPGAFSTLSIRGSNADQVSVYLDGIPLNQSLGGGVNLGDLSLAAVERLEVYKSHIPPRFQDAPIGGVLNIITKAAAQTGKPATLFKTFLGSHGHQQTSLDHLDHTRNGKFTLLLNTERYKGDFDYFDDFGTPFNPADDRIRTRANNSFERADLLAGYKYYPGPHRSLQVTFEDVWKTQGVPGFGVAQSRTSRLQTDTRRLNFDLTQFPASRRGKEKRLSLRFSDHLSRFQDLDGRIGANGVQDNRNRTRLWRLESGLTKAAWGNHATAELHTSLQQETYTPRDRANARPVGLTSERHSLSLAGRLHHEQRGGRFSLSLIPKLQHVRSEVNSTYEPFAIPTKKHIQSIGGLDFAAVYRPSLHTDIRLTYGAGKRLPSFYELFGDRGGVIGNPSLSNETSKRWELGARRALGRLSLDAVWFTQDSRNLIVFEQTGQFVSRPVNTGKAAFNGQELTLAYRFSKALSLTTSFTHNDARNKSGDPAVNGKKLPGISKNALFYQLDFQATPSLRFSLDGTRRSGTPVDTANFNTVPSQHIYNLRADFTRRSHTWWLAIKNAGDNTVQDLQAFPLPGKQLYLGWQKRL